MSILSSRADGAAEPVAYAAFLKAHPEYDRTNAVDALRASDYRRLDAGRHVYLDYTGGGLHAESQVPDSEICLACPRPSHAPASVLPSTF